MNIKLLTTLLAVSASSLYSQAATLPYTNDFSTPTSADEFDTSAGSGSWTVSGGSYINTPGNSNSQNITSISALDVTGIGGATPQDFNISTTFTPTGAGSSGNVHDTIGFALFGDSTSSFGDYLLIDWNVNNHMRILSIGGSGNGDVVNSSISSSGQGLNYSNGDTYTMSLDFDYTGTNLQVTFGITDGTDSASLTSASFDTATSGLDGSTVAFRNREGDSTSGALSIAYDNLSITAIPEPSTMAMMLICGLSLIPFTLRRRK